jgi:fumarate hydratase subunit beta
MSINIDLDNDLKLLRESQAGTSLILDGKIYTARDAAHKRFKSMLDNDEKIEILKNKIIYYMGPTPAREGYPIGSAGPTSSYRMDDYIEVTFKLGVIATIGKGNRNPFVIDLIKKYQAPYLVTIGGAGAYLAECIKESKTVLFDDLGAEAVRELTVENFPVIVGIDIYGNSTIK